MATGIIKKIVAEKGFGFISPDDGSADVFFHMSAVAKPMSFDDLREQDKVSYENGMGPKGPNATNVTKM